MGVIDMTKQLEQILNCSVIRSNRSLEDIALFMGPSYENATIEKGQYIEGNYDCWLVMDLFAEYCEVIEFQQKTLSTTEMQLIAILLLNRTSVTLDNQYAGMTKIEKQATKLGEWLQSQMDAHATRSNIPEHLIMSSSLYHEMVPILLIADSSIQSHSSYSELDKLLRSFLSEDVLLIPLPNDEWLIWGPTSLLRDDDSSDSDHIDEETLEDSLSNIAHGLHDMLASEWIGESQIAITYPIVPAKSIIETIGQLRESIHIGRKFHVGTNIHLPWLLQLEVLLHAIPEVHRQKYLEQSLKRADLFVETEMLATLETFFSLDCNVSETAKKLYIHRNTLLYRLDKLKHETGLDVRLFRDAVLVKIILLLYKVTKTH
ncbi:MAG TPA: helix-turn-helix domain-containing protein [Candidatus Paenibacillus intestinavium]|nr:helix-turn-helix domain-containing protein [Candidatus Paenibacillus intestinavium]